MDATSIFLARKLLERIDEKREVMLGPMISGALDDYAKYRDQAGYLRALREVREWIEAINLEDDRRGS